MSQIVTNPAGNHVPAMFLKVSRNPSESKRKIDKKREKALKGR